MNKMYNMELVEYINGIKTKIIKTGIYDTLEDAIYSGKNNLISFIRDLIEYEKDDNISKIIQDYINNALINGIEYSIIINVFSTNRKKFIEAKDLIDYLNNNIINVPDCELYDFLLSLVEYDTRIFDYNGNYQSNMIIGRSMLNTRSYDLDFTEDSCKYRKYKFKYL